MTTPIATHPAVIDALKELSGSERIRSHVKDDPDTGLAVYAEGYRVHPTGLVNKDGSAAPMIDFVNHKGQTVQVPLHRVHELVGTDGPDGEVSEEILPAIDPLKRTRAPRPPRAGVVVN